MRPRITLGRWTLFLWAGSWSWPIDHFPCEDCRNWYLGPFGVEHTVR